MGRKDIHAHLITIIGAGHDTSSYLISMCMYMLAKCPHVQKKVQDEIQFVFQGRKDIQPEQLKKLHYLQAVLKESMRFNTVVGALSRKATQDTTLVKKYNI